MKKTHYLLFSLIVLLVFAACKEEDRYQTSVVQNYKFYLNGEPWEVNTGLSTRPIYIYNSAGEYVANYSSFYSFVLPNGAYHFLATPSGTILLPDSVASVNLKDLTIPQSPLANQAIQISGTVEYSSPFKETLQLFMTNRTGTLTLKAKDLTADPSYNSVRAVITAKRSAYRVSDETFVESPMELVRSKASATGGVNYTDDFILLQTKDAQNGVSIRFEMLNSSGEIVRSKELEGLYEVLANEVTLVEFFLNE